MFPLPYYNGDKKLNIDEHRWKHDDLFTKQHYYTLLFDKEEDMDLVGDTALTSVQVEWIFVKTRMMKKYYFERIKGAWMLEAINLRPIEQDDNEDFVEFFGRFAVDSLFQSRRIREPLIFVPAIRMTTSPFWRQRSTGTNGLPSNRNFLPNVSPISTTDRETMITRQRRFLR